MSQKIIYLSNFFNHHQKAVADKLYELSCGEYLFVETGVISEEQRLLGYHGYDVPYVVRYSLENQTLIDNEIFEAKAVIHGEAPIRLIKKRIKAGKLTFRDDERRYKSICKYLKWPIYTYNSLFFNKCYLLCSSAFCARDYSLSGMRPDKCFKWGYFTETVKYVIDSVLSCKFSEKHDGRVKILWACRMIDWKHPEMAILLAKRLHESGFDFCMDIIGRGNMSAQIEQMISTYKLSDIVKMLGAMPPEQVRHNMERADIFISTSDKYEGWGATINEAMNSVCAVVASHAIGSVPFLIEDGVNGLIYRCGDAKDLFDKVTLLIKDKTLRHSLAYQAYKTMTGLWSAESAAISLYKLITALTRGECTPIEEGPCSRAPLMNDSWYK